MRILRNPRIRTFARGTFDFEHGFLEVPLIEKELFGMSVLVCGLPKKRNKF